MDNLVTNCDRSKLSTVSCLLMGTKAPVTRVDSEDGSQQSSQVAEVCQEACEMLDLDQVHKAREQGSCGASAGSKSCAL